MIRRPPRSTRTDTLFPYTTLFRSGRETLRDANELHIPVGKPVLLELEAANVIHSFWVPRLGGKMDMIPGRTNRLLIQADAPGIYKGQCAEYCGGPHALMGFVVVAHTPQDFARWKDSRQPRGGERSEERRVGQECVSTGRSRWSRYN